MHYTYGICTYCKKKNPVREGLRTFCIFFNWHMLQLRSDHLPTSSNAENHHIKHRSMAWELCWSLFWQCLFKKMTFSRDLWMFVKGNFNELINVCNLHYSSSHLDIVLSCYRHALMLTAVLCCWQLCFHADMYLHVDGCSSYWQLCQSVDIALCWQRYPHSCWQQCSHVDRCILISLCCIVLSLCSYVYNYAPMLTVVPSYWQLYHNTELCSHVDSCAIMLTAVSSQLNYTMLHNHVIMLTVMVTVVPPSWQLVPSCR